MRMKKWAMYGLLCVLTLILVSVAVSCGGGKTNEETAGNNESYEVTGPNPSESSDESTDPLPETGDDFETGNETDRETPPTGETIPPSDETCAEAESKADLMIEDDYFYSSFNQVIRPALGQTTGVEATMDVADGVLTVKGKQKTDGMGSAYATLYDDLKIRVEEQTKLRYAIKPQDFSGDGARRKFPSMYVAVDLKFSDGTRMSTIAGLQDENCVGVDPTSQGDSMAMYPHHDNIIIVPLGSQAGKVITEILIGYEDKDGVAGTEFSTEIDSIEITAKPRKIYENATDYVLTTRGTNPTTPSVLPYDSRGLTHPFVAVPQGFNLWTPENQIGAPSEHHGSIYEYRWNYIEAFRCSHQVNFHTGDPAFWKFMITNGTKGNTTFSHDNEIAEGHYYSVIFDNTGGQASGSRVEITATDHGAAVRLTYGSDSEKRGILLENVNTLKTSSGNTSVDKMTFSEADNSFTVVVDAGSYSPHSWANGIEKMYVYGTFDTPVSSAGRGVVWFDPDDPDARVVTMTVATSFMSIEQAKRNYELELLDESGSAKSFDRVCAEAEELWLDILGKVEIEGATEDQLITYYSSLYRLYLSPTNMGEYTGKGNRDGWQYVSPYGNGIQDGKLYYGNGLWDTFRTAWPAYAFFTPEKDAELLNGLLCYYEDHGWIPRWITPAGIDCMIGTSTDIVFGDALMRGVNFDYKTAYAAALKNATVSSFNAPDGRAALYTGIFLGYITSDDLAKKSVSWSLDNAINDYGAAQLARAVGDDEMYQYLISRAQNYSLLFDTDGYWFRSKTTDGKWAYADITADAGFEESDAMCNAFGAPHDGQALVALFGGRANLVAKLDEYFNGPTTYHARVGRLAFDNETCLHVPYMYLYGGRPDRTQELVRTILMRDFTGGQIGGGYTGDDDNGAFSAWYLFSSMGLYPLNMGSGELVFGSPLFTKMTIRLDNGNTLTIEAPNNSPENVYVRGVTINGVPYHKTSILQTELFAEDTVIVFDMTDKPSDWGTAEDAAPTSVNGSAAPDPLQDCTIPQITIVDRIPDADVYMEQCYVSGADVAGNLFDNNAMTMTHLAPENGQITIYYHLADPVCVEMYTLTSGSNKHAAPVEFTLYGSKDGHEWVKLDSRSGESWAWAYGTRPFAIENPDYYQEYRLDILSDTTVMLAEVELLAVGVQSANRYLLQSLVDKMQSADFTDLPTVNQNALSDAVAHAKKVLEQEQPSEEVVDAAYWGIRTALEDCYRHRTVRTELLDVYNTYKDIKQSVISGGTWGAVVDALARADALLGNPESEAEALAQSKADILAALNAITVDYANALLDHIVEVNANHSQGGNEAPKFGVDGMDGTKWCSTRESGGYYWLTVELDREYTVATWIVRSAGTESMRFIARDFELQVMGDDGQWRTVSRVENNEFNTYIEDLAQPVVGKKFRLLIDAETCGDGNCRIQEFQLFERIDLRANLQEVYENYRKRTQGIFSNETWRTLMDAVENAARVLADDTATEKTIRDAINALSMAEDALKADYTRALTYRCENITANHSQGGAESPEGAFDGNENTKWCSTQPNNGAYWITVDLGRVETVTSWFVRSAGSEGSGYIAHNFDLQVLDEAGNWKTVARAIDNGKNDFSADLAEPVTGQVFRLYLDAATCGDGYCRIQEFHLCGIPKEKDETAEARAVLEKVYADHQNQVLNIYTASTREAFEQAMSDAEKLLSYTGSDAQAILAAAETIKTTAKALTVDYQNAVTYKLPTVSANHSQGGAESPAGALDGNENSKWCSTQPENGAYWLTVDLGRAYTIEAWFVLSAGTESPDYIAHNFELQVQKESGEWVTVSKAENNQKNAYAAKPDAVKGQIFRLYIDAATCGDGYCRIKEFQLFGAE